MGNNGTTANVLATIGTICWCVQLSPQIWTNWRRKSTEGLPESMMCLWMVCMLFHDPAVAACKRKTLAPPVRNMQLRQRTLSTDCSSLSVQHHEAALPFGVYIVLQVSNL